MRELIRKVRSGIIITVVILTAFANAGTTGKIVGLIKDKTTGDPLIGANIILEGTSMGAATDIDGYFAIINVPPGTYSLKVFYVGYVETTIEKIRINVDRTTTQNLEMDPAAVAGEAVTVEAIRPAVELDKTHTSTVVNSETVEMMPVTELEEVIELQGGVVSTGGQLHFRGGRAREVTYVIDGIAVNNGFSQDGGSLVEIDNNMIEELEVISGTFNAEYGQAQSGVINIVTKRPASSFSGSVKAYSGDFLSTREDQFLGIKNIDPLSEADFQFSLTGPIIAEKLGFFITGRINSYESLDWFERRFNPIDGWQIAAYRRWFTEFQEGAGTERVIQIPDSLVTGDREQGPLNTGSYRSLQVKLLYSLTPKMTVTLQGFGSFDESDGPFDQDRQGGDQFFRYAPDNFGTIQQWDYSGFLKFQHFPSDNFFYNVAFSFQREDGDFFLRKDNKIARYPGDDGIQLITAVQSLNFSGNDFPNVFSLGGGSGNFYSNAPGKNYRDQYSVQGDLNWQIDKHNFIKAGVSVKQGYANIYAQGYRVNPIWQSNTWLLYPPGEDISYGQFWNDHIDYWTDWETEHFPNQERVVAAQPNEANLFRDFNVSPMEAAAYIQDKLEMGDIIVNAGVRFDYFDPQEQVPINYRTESFNLGKEANLTDASVKTQLSPRFGISFPVSSNGAFHASYGHFFQLPAYLRMYNEPLVSLTPFQLQGRTLGNANLKPEKTIAYEIGLQQAVTDNIAVDVTAYYKDFNNLLGIEQLVTVDAVTYRRYVNRDYGNNKGFTIDATKSGGIINGGMNYTYSFANGSASDPAQLFLINTATRVGGEQQTFPERKILPLNWDQRHTFNAYINLVKTSNWSIGMTGFLVSGTPYSPDFLERFDISDREYRNLALKPTRWTVDLKAKKHFKFGDLKTILFLKIDNLFDNLNAERVFARSGTADQNPRLPEIQEFLLQDLDAEGFFTIDEVDLRPDNFSLPRQVQIGMEIKF